MGIHTHSYMHTRTHMCVNAQVHLDTNNLIRYVCLQLLVEEGIVADFVLPYTKTSY